ncbi:MAG: hypothetical protein Hyperionvirus15_15 [Hyperionvirus sp.]|uniref:Uncharacterized protein n=1 Tax=Hyperionvirus sp. TaxID=2487770 RepID=A0A3G5A9N6_9VIRU|nr:MAG: hypothetical protein Hyperionvirus15_15 [Hyperionvirus sp.]
MFEGDCVFCGGFEEMLFDCIEGAIYFREFVVKHFGEEDFLFILDRNI